MSQPPRTISPTLRLGVTFTAQVSDGIITSLTSEGDFLWGRNGRYPVSYFLMEAALVNNVIGKSFDSALRQVLSFMDNMIERRRKYESSFGGGDALYETLTQELELDIKEYLQLNYPSDWIQKAIIEEIAVRYMDIVVHGPLAFIPGENAPEEVIQKQKESLQFLAAMEKMLSNK
ncbi:hypothetical protein FDP41_010052 [Naegleria fowleri]|uniref:Uncharacterized protein n=1 Tax=Naegleria fowleri TaxID=5763 RepID=A0A6A5BFJ1_NAEFO|nr:uncharacterized protein FDP41_010052 [Naegleria fowleri]KAF0971829.1 hypothetical protein FDP41_010052 [Naegleria fowleri]CAG4711056.1 unnamed protein product [Naegleria fowleri]